jgi:hypothetical protein
MPRLNDPKSASVESRLPEELIEAYLKTEYRAVVDGAAITLRISAQSSGILSVFEQSKTDCAAFITAENPYSEPQTPAVNAERQQRLRNALSAMGIPYFPGQGQGEDPAWPAEASFLALGIDREASITLGRKYGQNAIVWVGSDGVPELLLLTSNGPTL